jgi:hypothetical protein
MSCQTDGHVPPEVIMQRFVRFLSILGALALGILTLGLALPATREGRAEAPIALPRGEVARVIPDVTAQPEWRSGVGRAETTATGWREVTARGETIDLALREATPGRIALSMRSDRGWSREWEGILTAAGDVTRIAVVEWPKVPKPLFRMIARLMFGASVVAATCLGELKARVEGP